LYIPICNTEPWKSEGRIRCNGGVSIICWPVATDVHPYSKLHTVELLWTRPSEYRLSLNIGWFFKSTPNNILRRTSHKTDHPSKPAMFLEPVLAGLFAYGPNDNLYSSKNHGYHKICEMITLNETRYNPVTLMFCQLFALLRRSLIRNTGSCILTHLGDIHTISGWKWYITIQKKENSRLQSW
jgi:hypothetical protein